MKILILSFSFLIGLYTLLRNNIYWLPGQLTWITHPDIFYAVFLALFLAVSSIAALISKENNNLFYLVACLIFIDFFHRLSVFVNHQYINLLYDVPAPSEVPEGVEVVVNNYWPSHIMGGIEFILIIIIIRKIIREMKVEINT